MANKTVSDIMTYPVVIVSADKSLIEVIRLLLRFHISGMPVVDNEDRIIGVVSELDILNFAMSGSAAATVVSEVMSRDISTFPPDTGIEMALNTFAEKRIRRVPVVRDGKVIGIVSRRDILREILEMYNPSA